MIEWAGGITAAQGFLASGVHCGIKRSRKDLSLVYSEDRAVAAGVFTTNKVPAAPVLVGKKQLQLSPYKRAIVINSGNANACTGERGLNDAWTMVRTAASALGIDDHEVLVSSTGVIGQYLPMENVVPGISAARTALGDDAHKDAAEAIMTTDTFSKEYAVRLVINGLTVTIGGMAKGSGMIAPNMATMLAFITTDVAIAPAVLHHALRVAADHSFNRISVDGDTSTNDMVLMLANGRAGNRRIKDTRSEAYRLFYTALEHVLVKLSKMIVMDGEGATKFVEINVRGAASEFAAIAAARAVANSNLVKTALHGEDANWGRILAAIGYSGIDFNPEEVTISFGEVPILGRNYAIDFSEADAKRVLTKKEVTIVVDLHQGDAETTFWTCDLSREYVAINANYRS